MGPGTVRGARAPFGCLQRVPWQRRTEGGSRLWKSTLYMGGLMAGWCRSGKGRVAMAQGSNRDDYVLIERGVGVKLRMGQVPGESEPTPWVYRCPTCGDETRLVMLVVNPPIRRVKRASKKEDNRPEPVQMLLSITKRQAEQLLEAFGDQPVTLELARNPPLSSRSYSRDRLLGFIRS